MMRFFFGEKNVKGKKLDGLDISKFLNKLMGDVDTQTFELPAVLFGMKFLELGLRAKDRDVNRRIRLFRSFAFDLIKRRVAELDEATAEGKAYHRTGDLIESLYLAKSLHDKTKTDDVYDYMELIEEFCTFFVAGTDTTYNSLNAARIS
jgi:cytochrome P450